MEFCSDGFVVRSRGFSAWSIQAGFGDLVSPDDQELPTSGFLAGRADAPD
jgi:hypothetical protein